MTRGEQTSNTQTGNIRTGNTQTGNRRAARELDARRFQARFTIVPLLCVVAVAASAQSSLQAFGIDGRAQLCVPGVDLNREIIRFRDGGRIIEIGVGKPPGFAFQIPVDALQAAIPGYQRTLDRAAPPHGSDVYGSLGFAARGSAPPGAPPVPQAVPQSAPQAVPACAKQIVSPVAGSPYFDVSCSTEARHSTLSDRAPAAQAPGQSRSEGVVATCRREPIGIGPYAGAVVTQCNRVTEIDGYRVEYTFARANARFIDAMDAVMTARVAAWSRNCASVRQ